MFRSRPYTLACILIAGTVIALMCRQSLCQTQIPATAKRQQTSHIVSIRDDIRLHYLDWGGEGPTVVLLAGLGNTAYIFADVAPGLTTSYRVLALTRRGYGESDVTQDGYGMEDRVEDIHAFCDKLQLSKVILVGHSAAGDELTAFAKKYPERVLGLVYLDAAYNRSDPATPKPHMDAWSKISAELYGGLSEDETYASRDVHRRALRNLFESEYGVSWNDALESDFIEATTENADGSLSPRTPWWVSDSIRKGVQSNPFEIPYKSVPALLVFARGRLEDQPIRITDKEALKAIEKDEDDCETYFNGFIRQLRVREPGLRIKILPKDRHYFFLHNPQILAQLLHELGTA